MVYLKETASALVIIYIFEFVMYAQSIHHDSQIASKGLLLYNADTFMQFTDMAKITH